MAKERTEVLNFRASAEQAKRFRRAAQVEALSLSEWLRRLALLRVAELGQRLDSEQP